MEASREEREKESPLLASPLGYVPPGCPGTRSLFSNLVSREARLIRCFRTHQLGLGRTPLCVNGWCSERLRVYRKGEITKVRTNLVMMSLQDCLFTLKSVYWGYVQVYVQLTMREPECCCHDANPFASSPQLRLSLNSISAASFPWRSPNQIPRDYGILCCSARCRFLL